MPICQCIFKICKVSTDLKFYVRVKNAKVESSLKFVCMVETPRRLSIRKLGPPSELIMHCISLRGVSTKVK